jgi:hypothetical protein
MCFACEQEQMLAAYREYVARRAALLRAKAEGGQGAAGDKPNEVEDWAKGTWFAAMVDEPDA